MGGYETFSACNNFFHVYRLCRIFLRGKSRARFILVCLFFVGVGEGVGVNWKGEMFNLNRVQVQTNILNFHTVVLLSNYT